METPAAAPSSPFGTDAVAPSIALTHAPSALESLAAAGFVSPGRTTSSSVDAEALTDAPALSDVERNSEQETAPPTATHGDDAMARYWQWMHARLE